MQLLGSSVGVIHAIYQLRKALLRLVFYFRENAARLYESSVKPNEKRYACEVKPEMKVDGRINKHDLPKRTDSHRINLDKRPNGPGILGRNEHDKYEPNKAMENKRYGDIVGSMGQVGEVLVAFVKRINEISGFQDELINQTFSSFAEELEYRVGAFERLRYTRNEGFNEHINILAVVFGQYLSDMHQALKGFQKNSIPIIQRAQEHRQLGLQGLSAMATFFSGITASTLQYQLNNSFAPLESVVNGLWIMSLACSVASAVSAQVIYFWCSSRSSSPDKYTPGVIGRVLKHTPVVYLTVCTPSTLSYHIHSND
ncbi:hypothetical protein B0J17DRAFT_374352 [Rhizoctonia solani]|nr:hypothetical protein B0J17DRAFT_374352 [Rhizoctonia solani]